MVRNAGFSFGVKKNRTKVNVFKLNSILLLSFGLIVHSELIKAGLLARRIFKCEYVLHVCIVPLFCTCSNNICTHSVNKEYSCLLPLLLYASFPCKDCLLLNSTAQMLVVNR